MRFEHEQVAVVTGARAGLTTIVAVHSTALGQAAGGCRVWRYLDWRDALEDALRLSEAMTLKSALAKLPLGGGKSVIALSPGEELTATRRRDALLDLGDLIESFDGRYGVGEDVGTTPEDMLVIRERTPHVFCLPVSHGGTGDTSEATALGISVSLDAIAQRLLGVPTLSGRRVTVVGVGHVGERVARHLAADGALLTVSDIDPDKRGLAGELGATWVEPEDAYRTDCDVLVPAALGGVLTHELVPTLRCRAVCGPANNQLVDPAVADTLAARGILWAPDFLVNAGGVIHGVLSDLQGKTPADVAQRTRVIASTLTEVLDAAEADGVNPLVAAERIARERVAKAKASR